MQHVVKYNKQKGCASLSFFLLDTGVEALNLNESLPIENKRAESAFQLKEVKIYFFYAKPNWD